MRRAAEPRKNANPKTESTVGPDSNGGSASHQQFYHKRHAGCADRDDPQFRQVARIQTCFADPAVHRGAQERKIRSRLRYPRKASSQPGPVRGDIPSHSATGRPAAIPRPAPVPLADWQSEAACGYLSMPRRRKCINVPKWLREVRWCIRPALPRHIPHRLV